MPIPVDIDLVAALHALLTMPMINRGWAAWQERAIEVFVGRIGYLEGVQQMLRDLKAGWSVEELAEMYGVGKGD